MGAHARPVLQASEVALGECGDAVSQLAQCAIANPNDASKCQAQFTSFAQVCDTYFCYQQ